MLQVQSQKDITYLVEYSQPNGTCGGVDLDPLLLTVSDFSTVLHIMETAAATNGARFEFSTTFTEADGNTGYIVDSIGNTTNSPPCYWLYYVRSGDAEEIPSVGIAEYVPGNNFRVILRYGEVIGSRQITTRYVVQHRDSVCTSATPPNELRISTPADSTALDVMEEAVRENGRSYRFSTRYALFSAGAMDRSYGHVIKQVGDVAENGSCYWAAFVTTPSGEESTLSVPVSAYTLPGGGYILTLRFLELQQPISTSTRSGAKVRIQSTPSTKDINFRFKQLSFIEG